MGRRKVSNPKVVGHQLETNGTTATKYSRPTYVLLSFSTPRNFSSRLLHGAWQFFEKASSRAAELITLLRIVIIPFFLVTTCPTSLGILYIIGFSGKSMKAGRATSNFLCIWWWRAFAGRAKCNGKKIRGHGGVYMPCMSLRNSMEWFDVIAGAGGGSPAEGMGRGI